jgi:hypothetical protein
MVCLPTRRRLARKRFRKTGSHRISRPRRGRNDDSVVFAPGWPRSQPPAPKPDDRAEAGVVWTPEVAFAPGWPLPSSLTRR